MYEKIDEIYEFIFQIFELNKYKITNYSNEYKLIIDLNFLININKNDVEFNVSLDLKPNLGGDFSSDFNYILRNEMRNMKKNFDKEISDLQKKNN